MGKKNSNKPDNGEWVEPVSTHNNRSLNQAILNELHTSPQSKTWLIIELCQPSVNSVALA